MQLTFVSWNPQNNVCSLFFLREHIHLTTYFFHAHTHIFQSVAVFETQFRVRLYCPILIIWGAVQAFAIVGDVYF